jgi:hypothetical protein
MGNSIIKMFTRRNRPTTNKYHFNSNCENLDQCNAFLNQCRSQLTSSETNRYREGEIFDEFLKIYNLSQDYNTMRNEYLTRGGRRRKTRKRNLTI